MSTASVGSYPIDLDSPLILPAKNQLTLPPELLIFLEMQKMQTLLQPQASPLQQRICVLEDRIHSLETQGSAKDKRIAELESLNRNQFNLLMQAHDYLIGNCIRSIFQTLQLFPGLLEAVSSKLEGKAKNLISIIYTVESIVNENSPFTIPSRLSKR